jgi:hypothetical protein
MRTLPLCRKSFGLDEVNGEPDFELVCVIIEANNDGESGDV